MVPFFTRLARPFSVAKHGGMFIGVKRNVESLDLNLQQLSLNGLKEATLRKVACCFPDGGFGFEAAVARLAIGSSFAHLHSLDHC